MSDGKILCQTISDWQARYDVQSIRMNHHSMFYVQYIILQCNILPISGSLLQCSFVLDICTPVYSIFKSQNSIAF